MCRESIKMVTVCGKMPSEARLEKIGVHQSMKGQFIIKYLIFRIIWKIPCVVQIFPVFYPNSLCFPCLENLITKFPVFPVAWPPFSSCTLRFLQGIPWCCCGNTEAFLEKWDHLYKLVTLLAGTYRSCLKQKCILFNLDPWD